MKSPLAAYELRTKLGACHEEAFRITVLELLGQIAAALVALKESKK